MKKNEILKSYTVYKLDDVTVFIQGRDFNFSYTIADSIVKGEFKGKHRYFGGLQCGYQQGTENYKSLENWLCEIAEMVLGIRKQNSQYGKICEPKNQIE